MTIVEGPTPVRTSTVGLSGREQRLVGVGQDRVGIDAHEKRGARGGPIEPRLQPDRKERHGIASVQCGDRLGLGWAEPGDGRGEAIAQPGLGCAGDPQRLPRDRVVAGGPSPAVPAAVSRAAARPISSWAAARAARSSAMDCVMPLPPAVRRRREWRPGRDAEG